MAAFYYGWCPAEGLLWRCECDGCGIEIYPWEKDKVAGEGLKDAWTNIDNSGDYEKHGVPILDTLQATIDLQVTNVTVYGESGSIVPSPVSTVPFRRFIKMLSEGVPIAEYHLPDGTGRLMLEALSREQRIKKFLNNAVPYIWAHKQ